MLAAALPAATGFAGTQDGAVFALHAKLHVKGDPCDIMDRTYPPAGCGDFTTSWPLNSSCDLYLVVAGADPTFGVAFASFGIVYEDGQIGAATMSNGEGVDLYGWTPCHSGYSVPYPPASSPDTFPASGSGLRVHWDAESDCQTATPGFRGVEAVIGCFYVFAYSRDYFLITENRHAPDGPEYLVGDCGGEWSEMRMGGWELAAFVWFSAGAVEQGNNPCLYTPVERASWSRLKTTYD